MSFADTWAAAKVNDSEKSDPPDVGMYEVAIEDARAFTAQSGKDWFVVDFKVLSGASAGHTWSVLANLGTDGGVNAAKSMSAKLGVPVDQVSGLESLDSLVKQSVGGYFMVEVVQKGDFRNTYIRERMNAGQPAVANVSAAIAASDAQAPVVYDDDIPF
jgi:hypothetical protein